MLFEPPELFYNDSRKRNLSEESMNNLQSIDTNLTISSPVSLGEYIYLSL